MTLAFLTPEFLKAVWTIYKRVTQAGTAGEPHKCVAIYHIQVANPFALS